MSTITQSEVTVTPAEGAKIKVRRMRWKATKKFLRLFAESVKTLNKEGKLEAIFESVKGKSISDNTVQNLLAILSELVTSIEELATHIAANSTMLTEEQFDELDTVDALEVLQEALKINFDEQLKKSLAGTGEALKLLFAAKEKTS